MSNPVRGEQSWGAGLMAWVRETLPDLLNGREQGEEGEALLALCERWEAEQSIPPTLPAGAAEPTATELTQDETPETE